MTELIHHLTRSLLVCSLFFAMAGCSGSSGGVSAPVVSNEQKFVVQKPYSSWRFGVMADSQWTLPDDGMNPNSVAVEIVRQVQRQLIQHDVKFVVQVGDFTDLGWKPNGIGKTAIDTRALFVQELYNNGIGFFPLRGNHEGSPEAAVEVPRVFPQTSSGLQNATPADVLAMPNPDAVRQPSPLFAGSQFFVGSNFNSPTSSLSGLSYSFDYGNARFILLDQFMLSDNTTISIRDQQPWITSQLASRPSTSHAFVFAHMDFDNMFGINDTSGKNAFIQSLAENKARYLVNGHVHMHDRSVLYASDFSSSIHQLICASSSSKFYVPAPPTNPPTYDYLRPPLAQELKTIGYYIYTVTGPNVTVDYYSASINSTYLAGAYQISTVPALNFTRKETFGYSLHGKEYLIGQGQSYDTVADSYSSRAGALPTKLRILGGSHMGQLVNGSGRPFSRSVQTGWSPMTESTSSDIASLWGLQGLGDLVPDTYVLSISYYPSRANQASLPSGTMVLASKNSAGEWGSAVAKNTGGTPVFVFGPWQPSYGLGTHGVDVTSNTVWAVLNHTGEFAAVQTP